MPDPRLWAITAYFNPCRYRSRLANFRTFRAHLGAPLVAVELAYGDGFDLEPGDADVLIRLRGQDVLCVREYFRLREEDGGESPAASPPA